MCGRYGFNCGSTLYMTGFADAGSAGLVAVNTTIAPAMGGIVQGQKRAQIRAREPYFIFVLFFFKMRAPRDIVLFFKMF